MGSEMRSPVKKPKKHPLYWKVKAAFLQHQQTVADANAAVRVSGAGLDAAIKEAGLDPATPYDMRDDTETITPKA